MRSIVSIWALVSLHLLPCVLAGFFDFFSSSSDGIDCFDHINALKQCCKGLHLTGKKCYIQPKTEHKDKCSGPRTAMWDCKKKQLVRRRKKGLGSASKLGKGRLTETRLCEPWCKVESCENLRPLTRDGNDVQRSTNWAHGVNIVYECGACPATAKCNRELFTGFQKRVMADIDQNMSRLEIFYRYRDEDIHAEF